MRLCSVLLLLSTVTATTLPGLSRLGRREDVCSDLVVNSNNGDRKVAIVIDSSGSMSYNDPYDYRLAAGKALADFLVSNGEVSGAKKADQVTVIDFDDAAYLDYPLGDPGNAGGSFSKIDADGGTYIASGVRMAIQQLTAGGTGTTDKRSAIVVFTDGEDSSTQELIDAINNATAVGIRVSFGFLDTSASSQPTKVLQAIRNSRGVYATITLAAGSINYINYVILNGLTYNDNAQGYDSQLLSGLAETHLISGSSTVTLKYNAQSGERVNFTVATITAGSLTAVAQMNGQTLQSSTTGSRITVTAPSSGEMQLLVTAKSAPQDSLFSVVTNSNIPIKNCTVGVSGEGGDSGLSTGAKAGIGVGVTAAVLGLLGLGGYFAWKHWPQAFSFGSGNAPMAGGTNAPMAGGGNGPMAGGGQGTMTTLGAEKMLPHTDIQPMYTPPSATPVGSSAPMGQAPLGSMPPGQAPMGTMPQAPMGTMPQAPMYTFPPDGGQSLMQAAPPAAAPAGGSYNAPMAFAPPGLPPNLSKPNGQSKDGQSQAPMDQKGQQIMGPDSFQHSVSSHPGQSPPEGSQISPVSPNAQHPLSPNGFQSPMVSPNNTGASDLNTFQHGMNPNEFQHTMAPGGQNIMGPPPQAPMGAEGYQHGMHPGSGQYTMAGSGSPAPVGADGYQHTMSPGAAQHIIGPGYQAPLSPDSFQHTMGSDGYNHSMTTGSPAQPLSPASSQYPLTAPSKAPFSHSTGISMPQDQSNMTMPHGGGAEPWPTAHSVNPISPESTGGTQAGFTMPGVQMRQGGREKKHHHHAWLAPDSACEHPECPLVAPNHVCSPDKDSCACTCRKQDCPVTMKGLGGSTV